MASMGRRRSVVLRAAAGGRRPAGERGAAAVIVALLMSLVLVGSAAFAVDIGVQRTARRDMQAIADVVALDLSRQLDGRTRSALAPVMDAQMAKSLARNAGSVGTTPRLTWDLGRLENNVFTPVTSSGVPTAVKVVARTDVGFAFGGVLGTSSGGAARTAISQASMGACFSVGSYAARINLGDGYILGPLLSALGTNIPITVLDAQGLAGIDVKLIDLVGTNLVAGGFDQLLSSSVTVGRFYLALAQAIGAQGGNAAQVALLNRLATVGAKDVVVRVADIVGLDTTGAAGLDAVVNLFDLVAATAFVANGTNAVSVPNLNVNVAGLSTLTAKLTVAQRPTLVCGRPNVVVGRSSQVDLDITGNLANVNLGVGVISAPISISLRLTPTAAALSQVTCMSAAKKLDFLVTNGLLSLDIVIGKTTDPNALGVKVTGINVINGYVRFYTSPKGGDTKAGSITVTDENYAGTGPFTTGDGSLGIPNLTPDSHLAVLPNVPLIGYLVNTLLGGIVNGVVTPLVSVVLNPILTALDYGLLSPLLKALGINIAGAETYARPKADCGIPKLVG